MDIIQSLRLDLAAIGAASRKDEVNLLGETLAQPNSKFSISLLRPKIGFYRDILTG